MGMAVVAPWDRKAFTITLPVEPADDKEGLTCMFCWGPRVDWTTTFQTNGRRVWAGIHEACIARLESAGSLHPAPGTAR